MCWGAIIFLEAVISKLIVVMACLWAGTGSGFAQEIFSDGFESAIFFVTNDHSGNIVIDSSVITNNIGGSWYPTYPQISNHFDTPIDVLTSIIR
jgi:hypothetical protein